MLEQLEGQLKQMERFVEDTQVNIKQVWKRKDDGLLVRVSGLVFQEPKRVMWRGLPGQDNPSAYGTVTETEFKEQYEYHPQKSPYQLNKQIRRNNNDQRNMLGQVHADRSGREVTPDKYAVRVRAIHEFAVSLIL